MEDIYIIGASGFGREVAWLIEELDNWNVAGFIDDNELMHGKYINNIPVIGGLSFLLNQSESINVVIAIASPLIRCKIYSQLKHKTNINFPNIIAKDVRISNTNQIGIGNIICTNSILTINISLGNFNHINLDCTIGHDVVLKDFVTIYPSVNISGNVTVGTYSEIGTGTQVIQGKTITENAIIGAGSVVIKDINESGTYVGSPVRKVK